MKKYILTYPSILLVFNIYKGYSYLLFVSAQIDNNILVKM